MFFVDTTHSSFCNTPATAWHKEMVVVVAAEVRLGGGGLDKTDTARARKAAVLEEHEKDYLDFQLERLAEQVAARAKEADKHPDKTTLPTSEKPQEPNEIVETKTATNLTINSGTKVRLEELAQVREVLAKAAKQVVENQREFLARQREEEERLIETVLLSLYEKADDQEVVLSEEERLIEAILMAL